MLQRSELLPHIYPARPSLHQRGHVAVRGIPLPLPREGAGVCLKCPPANGNFGKLVLYTLRFFLDGYDDGLPTYRSIFLPKAQPRRRL